MSQAKSKILSAATELFLSGGTSALSVRAISKKAGVSTIGIYSHFNGKQGILDELYIEGFQLVHDAMNIDVEGQSPKDIIMQGVQGYLDIAEKYEAHYRLIFGESDPSYTPSDIAQKASEQAFNRLIELASLLLPEHTSQGRKQRIALEVWAFLHGYVSLKHHVIASTVTPEQWNYLALRAVETHIDTIIDKHG